MLKVGSSKFQIDCLIVLKECERRAGEVFKGFYKVFSEKQFPQVEHSKIKLLECHDSKKRKYHVIILYTKLYEKSFALK